MIMKKILTLKRDYDDWIVPSGTVRLTLAVDVQLDYFWYSIKAHSADGDTTRIGHGTAYNWSDIEDIQEATYFDSDGNSFKVYAAAIDSGYRTDEVYDYISMNSHVAIPVKGSSRELRSPYNKSRIVEKNIDIWVIDTAFYKNIIAGKIDRSLKSVANNEKCRAGFWVNSGCNDVYARQITSEHLTEEINSKTGEKKHYWAKKTAHAQNHLLDCEVYHAFLADLIGVRFMKEKPSNPQQNQVQNQNIHIGYTDTF